PAACRVSGLRVDPSRAGRQRLLRDHPCAARRRRRRLLLPRHLPRPPNLDGLHASPDPHAIAAASGALSVVGSAPAFPPILASWLSGHGCFATLPRPRSPAE